MINLYPAYIANDEPITANNPYFELTAYFKINFDVAADAANANPIIPTSGATSLAPTIIEDPYFWLGIAYYS